MISTLLAALVAAVMIGWFTDPARRWAYVGLSVVLTALLFGIAFPNSRDAADARRQVGDVWFWSATSPAGTSALEGRALCGRLERDQLAVASARRQVLEAASSRGTLARGELEEYFGLLERLKALNALCQERVRGIASPQEPIDWSPIFVIGLLVAGGLSVSGIIGNNPHWRNGGVAIAVIVAAAWIYFASATAAAAPPRPLPCPAGTKCFSPAEAREVFVPLGPEWSEWYLFRLGPGAPWGLTAPNGTEFQSFGGEVLLFEEWAKRPTPTQSHLRFRNSRGGSATFRAK